MKPFTVTVEGKEVDARLVLEEVKRRWVKAKTGREDLRLETDGWVDKQGNFVDEDKQEFEYYGSDQTLFCGFGYLDELMDDTIDMESKE